MSFNSTLNFEVQENKIILLGNTFALKEKIKQVGGRWNAQDKHWWLVHSEQNLNFLETLGFRASLDPRLRGDDGENKPRDDKGELRNDVSQSFPRKRESSDLVRDDKVFFKISEFVQIISAVVKDNLSKQYWIYGELSSLKTANNHLFFDLVEKDESLISSSAYSTHLSLREARGATCTKSEANSGAGTRATQQQTANSNALSIHKAASISCILWAGKRKILQEKLDEIPFTDGTKIKIKVSVDFRKEGARIISIVEDIDSEHTKGSLLLQRLAIVQELKKRNLYQKNKLTTLNKVPTRIALLTAANSRACADFVDELKLSKISFQVSLFDCNMQGENTSNNIVCALKNIAENYINKYDCVVITRGGGSKLDLRWFDDLEIAKQIAYCPLPVLTAVGHFDDISISDEVSFRSEKTPTAAARFLSSQVHDSFVELFVRVDNIAKTLVRRFEKERQALNLLEQKISLNVKRRLQSESKNIERLEQFLKIFSTSIEKTMQRGFALVYDAKGKILTGKDFAHKDFPRQLKVEFSLENSVEKKTLSLDVNVEKVRYE